MGPLVTEGRQCHPSLGDALLRSNSGSNYPTRQADVLRDWAQQHRPRRRHSHGPWCSARDGSNAAVLERNMTAQAPTRLAQTPQEGPTRQGSDAAARKHARQQLLVLAPKPRAWSPAPRAPKRSLALEGSTALTSLMLARALGTTVEQVSAARRCSTALTHTAAPCLAHMSHTLGSAGLLRAEMMSGIGTCMPGALTDVLAGGKAGCPWVPQHFSTGLLQPQLDTTTGSVCSGEAASMCAQSGAGAVVQKSRSML